MKRWVISDSITWISSLLNRAFSAKEAETVWIMDFSCFAVTRGLACFIGVGLVSGNFYFAEGVAWMPFILYPDYNLPYIKNGFRKSLLGNLPSGKMERPRCKWLLIGDELANINNLSELLFEARLLAMPSHTKYQNMLRSCDGSNLNLCWP
jgi:hypothetical protein